MRFVSASSWAVEIAHVCACAEVQLLRYPVPIGSVWTTMAVGAISLCPKQSGEATLITALQSARTLKALCAVLHADTQTTAPSVPLT